MHHCVGDREQVGLEGVEVEAAEGEGEVLGDGRHGDVED